MGHERFRGPHAEPLTTSRAGRRRLALRIGYIVTTASPDRRRPDSCAGPRRRRRGPGSRAVGHHQRQRAVHRRPPRPRHSGRGAAPSRRADPSPARSSRAARDPRRPAGAPPRPHRGPLVQGRHPGPPRRTLASGSPSCSPPTDGPSLPAWLPIPAASIGRSSGWSARSPARSSRCRNSTGSSALAARMRRPGPHRHGSQRHARHSARSPAPIPAAPRSGWSWWRDSAPQKDHPTLLRALAGLRDLAWELDLIGDGPLMDETQALAASLGLADRVRFLGQRMDVDRLLAAPRSACW